MIPIEDRESQFGAITIYRRRATGALVYSQSGSLQSEADANGVSTASYIHAIYGLALQAQAKNVLMIGCGGGTLGTMLAHAGCEVTIVDINPDAFTLARRHFNMPKKIACHVMDGDAYLARETRLFDGIILDAYAGDVIPPHLRTPTFFRRVRCRLSPRGALFSNVHICDDDDGTADAIVRTMAEIWSQVRLLDAPGWYNRNAIVMAGNVLDLTPPELVLYPSEQSDEIASELSSMQFRPWTCAQEPPEDAGID